MLRGIDRNQVMKEKVSAYDRKKMTNHTEGRKYIMKRKMKGSLIALMALSQVTGIVASPILTVQAQTFTLTTQATEQLNKTKEAVIKMETSPTKEAVKAAMDSFIYLFSKNSTDKEGDMALLENAHAASQFNRIIVGLNKQNASTKNELTIYFFNHMGLRYGNERSFYYEDFLEALTDNTTDAATHEKLMLASGQLNQMFVDVPGLEGDSKGLDKEAKGDLYHIKDGQLKAINPLPQDPGAEALKPAPVESVEVDSNIPMGSTDEFDQADLDSTWQDIYYEVVDGKPVRVTITYTNINGKVTSEVKRENVAEHEAYAGTAEDWEFLLSGASSEDLLQDLTLDSTQEEEDEKSNLTLHYTVTKGTDDVYYYDTGMRVTVNKETNKEEATYQQVKDVLYQLALRAEGYLAEDEDKFLIVVEGQPVLIRESKEMYNKEEVEAMFKGFETVDMRIMPTRIGTTASLEEQLVSGQEQSVKVNGEDANLTHHPLVEDSHVLLSIEELASLLDLDFEVKDKKHIVSNDKHSVAYEENVKAVTVDGEVKETATPSIRNEAGALMGDITEVLTTFEIEMVWDEEESTILLQTK